MNDDLNTSDIISETSSEINSENLDEIVYNISLYDANINIIDTIQDILNNLRNTPNLLDINNIDDNSVELNIEFEFITTSETNNLDNNYFKNCKEINEKVSKSEKIKKNDILLNENCLVCIENYI